MVTARPAVFVWATGLAKLLSGESQCVWAAWLHAHYKHGKLPSEFDPRTWVIEHAAMVDEEAERLRASGYDVFTEGQNWLRLERDGITLGAKPDIIAVKDNRVVIRDMKTGARCAWHVVQMTIYLLILPYARPGWKHHLVDGAIVYREGPLVSASTHPPRSRFRAHAVPTLSRISADTAGKSPAGTHRDARSASGGARALTFRTPPASECDGLRAGRAEGL
jgi:PD-(D/E)XK nuclease superfamily protein